ALRDEAARREARRGVALPRRRQRRRFGGRNVNSYHRGRRGKIEQFIFPKKKCFLCFYSVSSVVNISSRFRRARNQARAAIGPSTSISHPTAFRFPRMNSSGFQYLREISMNRSALQMLYREVNRHSAGQPNDGAVP